MKAIIAAILLLTSLCAFAQPIPPPVIYPITVVKGGTGDTTAPDDNLLIGTGTAWTRTTIPDCPDTSGNHLNYVQSTNSLSCGTSGGSSSTWTRIEKATTETRVSDATLANDSALSFAADAGATYLVNIYAWCSTNASADFKYAVTAPSGGTSFIITGWTLTGGGNQAFQSTTSNSTPGTSYSLTGAGGSCLLNLNLYIENGATPGTIALQWAQNTLFAGDTSVLARSYIEYRQLP